MNRCEKCRHSTEFKGGGLGCTNQRHPDVQTLPFEQSPIYYRQCPSCDALNPNGMCQAFEPENHVVNLFTFLLTLACCYGMVRLVIHLAP